MPYQSRVYRILIASPSDVEEEREIAVRVIQEWNDLYSYTRKIVLLPLRWETHTAPEYGTRPQEVINRAIVDQCDLLVGVFWTRIGSPTGVADSGTLEEIDRVGKAEKPIMLYFSHVPIDPGLIDVEQSEKLREFRAQSYPKGLTENYKSIIEFRDKFSKQLELRVRELQRSDESGSIPLSLEFVSLDEGELAGNQLSKKLSLPVVSSFEEVPTDRRDKVRKAASAHIKELAYVPLPLAIRNASSAGIRNVYMELDIQADAENVEITDSPEGTNLWSMSYIKMFSGFTGSRRSSIAEQVNSKLARFDSNELQKTERGWKLSIEWEAIQPQRTRLVKPVLFAYAEESTRLRISARVFGDSFPEPFTLDACVELEVSKVETSLTELIPEWKELLSDKGEVLSLSDMYTAKAKT